MRDAQGLIDDGQALAQVVLDKVSSAWDNLQEYPAGSSLLHCLPMLALLAGILCHPVLVDAILNVWTHRA